MQNQDNKEPSKAYDDLIDILSMLHDDISYIKRKIIFWHYAITFICTFVVIKSLLEFYIFPEHPEQHLLATGTSAFMILLYFISHYIINKWKINRLKKEV